MDRCCVFSTDPGMDNNHITELHACLAHLNVSIYMIAPITSIIGREGPRMYGWVGTLMRFGGESSNGAVPNPFRPSCSRKNNQRFLPRIGLDLRPQKRLSIYLGNYIPFLITSNAEIDFLFADSGQRYKGRRLTIAVQLSATGSYWSIQAKPQVVCYNSVRERSTITVDRSSPPVTCC